MSSNKRTMSDDSRSDARSYPRKRVSIACEVCRLRKTRCDAAKPACSFCSDLGIECVYKRPADASRPDNNTRSDELHHALERLDKIESALESIAGKLGVREPSISHSNSNPFISTPVAFRQHDPVTPSPASVSAAGGSRRRYACKMPNLLVFKAPTADLGEMSYNCTDEFFNDQMEAVADMRQHIHLPHPEPDLSRPHLWRLQRAFADNVLRWLPLFDPETASRHLQYAQSSNHEHTSASLCLVFLMYAIGSISGDTSLYSVSGYELPGFAYYARAISILERLPSPSRDLNVLQCRVLVTVYLLFAMRPLEAWKVICQVSQECIVLLRASHDTETASYQEAFKRIYWICYVLENELEACLEVPSSGIRLYETRVALPISHYEEEGMYYLLALSSLRRVMVEVLDTVGYKSSPGLISYAPAVALELRNQINDWYHHLPAPLRFPLDHSLLFDTRKAYLRCSYHALIAVASWPSVLQINNINGAGPSMAEGEAAAAPTGNSNSNTDEESARLAQAANECLAACRDHLTLAEEILTQKSLVSHLIVRQYFAFTIILLLVFSGPDLTSPGTLEERRLLEQAMRNLSYWNVVPFMQGPLREMARIARLKGLTVPGL